MDLLSHRALHSPKNMNSKHTYKGKNIHGIYNNSTQIDIDKRKQNKERLNIGNIKTHINNYKGKNITIKLRKLNEM